MAVEIATLKPLFPGGNEVDQVWRVCEIMGSPGNWYNKAGGRVGGGDWKEGTRLAGKLGFSFPKMAPHSMDTILQQPQWPASLSHFVTWCLMWDPKNRPTSTQALAHEYFADAVDPLRPKSSASKILGRKQSDIGRAKDSASSTPGSTSKPSWFRKSLIGRSDNNSENSAAVQVVTKDVAAPRPSPVQPPTQSETSANKTRPPAGKRTTWSNGPSNVAPMPILPTIRPISPLSDAVTAQASSRTPSYNGSYAQIPEEKGSKKIGRQLSVQSGSNQYAEAHRQQAERALNGHGGLASPPSGQKESFFSHLRKRARRLSGRHQTPVSPSYDDLEAQAGCGPWASNRSSMVIDQQGATNKADNYESLDKTLRDHPKSIAAQPPVPPAHIVTPNSGLKRHHSLPHHQPRSVDNLIGAARTAGPISSRTRRAQATHGVPGDALDEEDELLDEVLHSTQNYMKSMDKDVKPGLRQSASNIVLSNPYPTPSHSASGNTMLFPDGREAVTPQPLNLSKRCSGDAQNKWPTPPYEDSGWAASASASIWAAGNRF